MMYRWKSMLFMIMAASSIVFLFLETDVRHLESKPPVDFQPGDPIDLKVNAMTSIHTQIPRAYYRLPFCQLSNGPKMASKNVGEFWIGNKIQSSPYSKQIKCDLYCERLCQIELSRTDANRLRMHIKHEYHNNWIIDNLPSATVISNTDLEEKVYRYGGSFPIGFMDIAGTPCINNHVNIYIEFHQHDTAVEKYRVVGFAVEPLSIKHKFQGGYDWNGEYVEEWTKKLETCPGDGSHIDGMTIDSTVPVQRILPNEEILFTYDVIWTEGFLDWSSRWDIYLSEDQLVPVVVHLYQIVNSILAILILGIVILHTLVRNLKRDIASDEETVGGNNATHESGWKSIHVDVFRPPEHCPMLFCICCGGGVQLVFTGFSTMGLLGPFRRGSLCNGMFFGSVLTGILGGYVNSRLYLAFGGQRWQLIAGAFPFSNTLCYLFRLNSSKDVFII